MKLFQITNAHTWKPVPDLVFADKLTAKLKRQELNNEANEILYFVSPGPDHRKYKSQKPPTRSGMH